MRQPINEWQDMSLKKDVENITKELQKNKSNEKPLILELYIAVITLVIDKLFDYSTGCEVVQKIVLYILFTVATVIFFYAVVVYIRNYLATRSKIKRSIYNIKPYIDLFDNNICYYALTASNFYENFLLESGSPTGDVSITRPLQTDYTDDQVSLTPPQSDKEKGQFYYIETHYYINKCISEISKMENIAKDIFTDNAEDAIYNSKIHFSRLKNIVDLLLNIRRNLYENARISDTDVLETDQISGKYDDTMVDFIKKINDLKKFSTELNWVKKTNGVPFKATLYK